MSLVKVVENSNVAEWLNGSPIKYTLQEICKKFGIDIENDPVNRIFWNINLTHRVLINEDMLNYMGYNGTFFNKNQSFRRLLKKNTSIEYREVADDKDPRKKYAILGGVDFEALLMQMRTGKSTELRTLFSVMKLIMTKYCEYEKIYANRLAEMSARQTNMVMEKLDQVSEQARNMERRAAEERQLLITKAIENEQHVIEEKKRAAEERQFLITQAKEIEERAVEERQFLITQAKEIEERAALERRQIEERAAFERRQIEDRAIAERRQISEQLKKNVQVLEDDIAPNLAPKPINSNKIHILGIYQMNGDGGGCDNKSKEWYMMRRQREGWNGAERKLIKRGMVLLNRWDNVSHAIDVGNLIKKHFRRHLSWDARGNRIKANPKSDVEVTDEYILKTIQSIIMRENCAHDLARENKKLVKCK